MTTAQSRAGNVLRSQIMHLVSSASNIRNAALAFAFAIIVPTLISGCARDSVMSPTTSPVALASVQQGDAQRPLARARAARPDSSDVNICNTSRYAGGSGRTSYRYGQISLPRTTPQAEAGAEPVKTAPFLYFQGKIGSDRITRMAHCIIEATAEAIAGARNHFQPRSRGALPASEMEPAESDDYAGQSSPGMKFGASPSYESPTTLSWEQEADVQGLQPDSEVEDAEAAEFPSWALATAAINNNASDASNAIMANALTASPAVFGPHAIVARGMGNWWCYSQTDENWTLYCNFEGDDEVCESLLGYTTRWSCGNGCQIMNLGDAMYPDLVGWGCPWFGGGEGPGDDPPYCNENQYLGAGGQCVCNNGSTEENCGEGGGDCEITGTCGPPPTDAADIKCDIQTFIIGETVTCAVIPVDSTVPFEGMDGSVIDSVVWSYRVGSSWPGARVGVVASPIGNTPFPFVPAATGFVDAQVWGSGGPLWNESVPLAGTAIPTPTFTCTAPGLRGGSISCTLALADTSFKLTKIDWLFTPTAAASVEPVPRARIEGPVQSSDWNGALVQDGTINFKAKIRAYQATSAGIAVSVTSRGWTTADRDSYTKDGLPQSCLLPFTHQTNTWARTLGKGNGCDDNWMIQPMLSGFHGLVRRVNDGGPNQGYAYVNSFPMELHSASTMIADLRPTSIIHHGISTQGDDAVLQASCVARSGTSYTSITIRNANYLCGSTATEAAYEGHLALIWAHESCHHVKRKAKFVSLNLPALFEGMVTQDSLLLNQSVISTVTTANSEIFSHDTDGFHNIIGYSNFWATQYVPNGPYWKAQQWRLGTCE